MPVVRSQTAMVRSLAVLALALAALLGVPTTAGAASLVPPGPRVRLMVVGDLMLARDIDARIAREGVAAPFRHVQRILDRADLLIGNLESVITTRGTRQAKLYTFRAPSRGARTLRAAGFDLVGVANNHALDFGRTGFSDTLRNLRHVGVLPMGGGADARAARAPVIVTRDGLRIAFLDRADARLDSNEWPRLHWEATDRRSGLAYARPRELRADVAAARRIADVVVVMLHSGREYATSPTKAQRRVVEAALAGGAALVVSAHPHVLQRGTRSGSTMVAWSLGNFVFDGFGTVSGARDSAILDVTLGPAGVTAVRWHPVIIRGGFPQPASGADRRRILARLGG
jgi:poly-gamma-glutamate capsule biosynthesis protein CapA/YwtB (metallophosphatase superfamily)